MTTHQAHLQPSSDPGGVAQVEPGATSLVIRRLIIGLLLTAVLVPPAAGFYSYFSGVPLHLLAGRTTGNENLAPSESPGVSLVPGQAHTLKVPEEVSAALGIRKAGRFSVAVAQTPGSMRPLVLPGSTAFDPSRLARIRARFAPARVVELAQVHDLSSKTGFTEFRELRQGDKIAKGQLLGVFYSLDVGTKKNDLLDALVQLELDQQIFDRVEKNRYAVPEVFYLTQLRAVQGDRNNINRALNNLRLWDIPQEEIDALHAEAKKISADKDGWSKTPEGRWVKGEKLAAEGTVDAAKENENPWGRVTLRAPFDGVVVEKNVSLEEMVVDNTVNLFQLADVSRLLVIASCPEDALPTLEDLAGAQRRWTVRTAGVASADGLPGTIDEIGYLIDPNQHTAVIKGYVENPGNRLRAGQFISASVNVPPPENVVEIPIDALVDDGRQSIVFVQPEANEGQFVMRRVKVTHRFEKTVFVRSVLVPEIERSTTPANEQRLLPEPLLPGERILTSGAVELKAALGDMEEERAHREQQRSQPSGSKKLDKPTSDK
jgi:cobalt-zinc-cadmium efflux system membrane fusion protein